MKVLRKLLVKILGLKGYLRFISRIYIFLIKSGFFKKKYAELHYLKQLVKPDDVVIDIGANLGYYSFFLSKHVGKNGHLIAFEPIPLFVEVWQKNMKSAKNKNFKILNCALGNETKEDVQMSIPVVDGIVRHGLTKIHESTDTNQAAMTFKVPMKMGSAILDGEKIERLDFIKCDVEGYEQYVIPSFEKYLVQYKPLIQVELSGQENKTNVANYLVGLGYQINILKDNKLNQLSIQDIFNFNQDFYFVHSDKK